MNSPGVTISVVSHGHGELLRRTLTDLARQTIRNCLNVVVTLNLEDEPFDPYAHPDLKIVVLRNAVPKGFGDNHNAAFTLCEDQWFLIVNPDVGLPDPTTIETLTTTLPSANKEVPPLGLVVPCIVNGAGEREDAVRSNLSPWSLMSRVLTGRKEVVPATLTAPGYPFFWVAGMFIAAWSEAFREIGGFDKRFFLYCEDYDLSARIYLSGRSIIVRDDVKIVHYAQRSSHHSPRHLSLHIQSLLKVWLSATFWRITLLRRV